MKPNHQQVKQIVGQPGKGALEGGGVKEQDLFFSSVMEQTSEGIAVSDLEGHLLFVSNTFAAMHGYSLDELAGKHLSVFHTPEQMPAVEAANREIKATGVFSGEVWHVRKDGTVFLTLMHNSLFRDETGKPVGMIGTVRDITDLKRVEEALKESEEKYRSLIERASDGIGIIQDGLLKYVNERLADIGGYTVEELTDQPFAKYVHPDEVAETAEYYEKRMKGEEVPERYERRLQHKNGSVLHTEVSGGVITYEDKPANLIMVRDVSDRKKAEESLRESEERFRLTFEHAVDAIFWADPETGIITKCNKTAETLLERPRNEIVGQHQKILHPADKAAYYRDMFTRHVRQDGTVNEDGEIITKSGETIPVHITASTIAVEGTPIVQGIFRDISERKLAEEALKASRDELERRVGERTAELREMNEQLRKEIRDRKWTEQELLMHHGKLRSLSSELALAEERERRRIAVEVHDRIAQNLAFAKINLGTLQSSTSSEATVEAVGEVIKLLDETIRDTRSLISELAPPVLYELGFVPALESLTRQTQKVHGIVFDFEDDGQPKPLSDDLRVLLFRAVRELIVNIIKHAQAKKAKVWVRVNDDHVCVGVEDDGVGFDTAKLQYSVRHAESDCFGFFSIQQRLHPLGGHLHVESTADHGTRVTLKAPLKDDREETKVKGP